MGAEYVGILPDYSCWYDRGGGPLEVQKKVNMNTSKIAELSYRYPYVLCQNVSLTVGQGYQLNFTVFNPALIEISEILVLINGVNTFNHTTLNQFNRSQASFNFTAASANTQICFDYFLNMTWTNHTIGPSLDNITL